MAACNPGVSGSSGTITCKPSNHSNLSVGDRLPSSAFIAKKDTLILGGPSQFYNQHMWEDGDYKFELGILKNDTVKFISINDPAFLTSQCIKVGMTINDVEAATGESGTVERGWAYYIPLQDGWNAAVMTSEKRVPGKTRVTFLFKK